MSNEIKDLAGKVEKAQVINTISELKTAKKNGIPSEVEQSGGDTNA